MSERIRIRNVYPFSEADKQMLAAIDPRLEGVHGGEDSADWLDALDDSQVQIVSGSETPSSLERLPRLRWWPLLALPASRSPWSGCPQRWPQSSLSPRRLPRLR